MLTSPGTNKSSEVEPAEEGLLHSITKGVEQSWSAAKNMLWSKDDPKEKDDSENREGRAPPCTIRSTCGHALAHPTLTALGSKRKMDVAYAILCFTMARLIPPPGPCLRTCPRAAFCGCGPAIRPPCSSDLFGARRCGKQAGACRGLPIARQEAEILATGGGAARAYAVFELRRLPPPPPPPPRAQAMTSAHLLDGAVPS